MDAKVRAAPEFEGQWQLSEGKDVPVTLVDYSGGGLGLHSRTFIPRGGLIVVHLDHAKEGSAAECVGRVQRVQMIDRTPTYYVGIAFVNDGRTMLGAIQSNANS